MPVAGGSTEALDAEKAGKAHTVVVDEKDESPLAGSAGPVEEEKKEEEKKDAPTAGPGSFTSVKYSGQPPGGASSFSLG